MAISNDYQFEYTNADGSSVLMGTGTDFDVVDIRGLGMPSVRSNDIDRLDADGTITSRKELLQGRTINIKVIVRGNPGDDLDASCTELLRACQVNDSAGKLSFQFPVGFGTTTTSEDVRFVDCFVRRVTKQVLASNSSGAIPHFIQFECQDPVIKRLTQNSETVTLSSFSGGTTFNETFNLTFGTGSSLAQTINNAGNYKAHPTVRFNGPVTAPQITNNTSGETIKLAGLTIPTGDYCDVDFYQRSILQSGTTSRYNKLTSDSAWWTLRPGTTSVTFSASSSTATTCAFKWYDTWV